MFQKIMMNIETLQAYPKLHFGPCRANGTLGVNDKLTCVLMVVDPQLHQWSTSLVPYPWYYLQ